MLGLERCPECGSDELRPDVTQGETDCVNCGWSVSWLGELELDILEPEVLDQNSQLENQALEELEDVNRKSVEK